MITECNKSTLEYIERNEKIDILEYHKEKLLRRMYQLR